MTRDPAHVPLRLKPPCEALGSRPKAAFTGGLFYLFADQLMPVAACSASAAIVCDGFRPNATGTTAPSMTNRFG